jgi:hypothetical protein
MKPIWGGNSSYPRIGTVAVLVERTLEIDHFIKTILEAGSGALDPGKKSGGHNPGGLLRVQLLPAGHRHGDFGPSVDDVGNAPAELAGLGVAGFRRLVDVREGEGGEGE